MFNSSWIASRVAWHVRTSRKPHHVSIFIDEIDAVGRQRGAGVGGGHDRTWANTEPNLVEMDGFGGNEGIIVIAAA